MATCLRIPLNRVGALIGSQGRVRKKIEHITQTSLDIDSKSGEIMIEESNGDSLSVWKAKDMVKAIGRGFAPKKALSLQNSNYYFYLIDLHDFLGQSPKKLKRMKGRVIGKEGKMRNFIEKSTKTYMSVYGKSISLIGTLGEIEVAKEAIKMLLGGAAHSTVVNFINRKKRDIAKKESELKKLNANNR